MNPGELDRRLRVYEIAEGRSASGEPVIVRNLYKTVPAKRLPLRGSRSASDASDSRTRGVASFVVRWMRDLSRNDRLAKYEVEEDGTRWRIVSAIETGTRRAYMQLDCETINEGLR